MYDNNRINFYNLKKLDLNNIRQNSRILILGKSHTGKTTLIKDLLRQSNVSKKTCITTKYDKEEYKEFIPSDCIYDEYQQETLQEIIKTQKKNIKEKGIEHTDNHFLVMDNCLYDNNWTTQTEMKYMFLNSRCDKISLLLTMPFPSGIPLPLRSNIDYIFILRENIISNRKKIYEYYASMFPSFDVFCNVMDQCTENYECLVIHNTANSNKLEDQVFWYKANLSDHSSDNPSDNSSNNTTNTSIANENKNVENVNENIEDNEYVIVNKNEVLNKDETNEREVVQEKENGLVQEKENVNENVEKEIKKGWF